MPLVEVHSARFYAFHGCHPLERRVGGRFEVDIKAETPDLNSDDLQSTVDYVVLMEIASNAMTLTSSLIESVASRIQNDILTVYPWLLSLEVTIRKLDAPVSIPHSCVSVTAHWPS